MQVADLLRYAVAKRASDLHLVSGMVPWLRIDGDLVPMATTSILDGATVELYLRQLLPPHYQLKREMRDNLDFGVENSELSKRFRVNIFQQQNGLSMAIRCLPRLIPTIEELLLPKIFYSLCELQSGLLLVTGPSGSGKSTTLAAMLDYINRNKARHILTIEDPIEYIYESKQSLVQQRELGTHTASFQGAIRAALRADPDYILIGELRDLATIRLALTAAETGHLVLATLHTNSAVESIERIIGVFPATEQILIRAIVANVVQAVVAQRLFKRVEGGRVAATEIMVATPATRNLIRENKSAQLYSMLQTGAHYGMCTLGQSLESLGKQGVVVGGS